MHEMLEGECTKKSKPNQIKLESRNMHRKKNGHTNLRTNKKKITNYIMVHENTAAHVNCC